MTPQGTIISWRVRTIWALRRLSSPLFVRYYIGLAVAVQFLRLVSISSVWHNAPTLIHPYSLTGYFVQAFMQTERSVQVLLPLLLAFVVFVFRDVIRAAWAMYLRRWVLSS